MANRVITIGNETVVDKKEVYIDLDMKATNAKYGSKYVKRIGKIVDQKAVENSLRNIFTWIPGERVLNPEFGNNLRKLLYEGITDINVERIVAEIRACVTQWEPRASIENIINISDVNDTEDNVVHLRIIYSIPGLSGQQYSLDIT